MTPERNSPEGFEAGAAIGCQPAVGLIAVGLADVFRLRDAERRATGERGRRLVEERFSWPKIAAEMTQAYEWVLGEGARPNSVFEK